MSDFERKRHWHKGEPVYEFVAQTKAARDWCLEAKPESKGRAIAFMGEDVISVMVELMMDGLTMTAEPGE